MLDDTLPDHLQGGLGPYLAVFFVLLGIVLLIGSVWFMLSTNVGGRRGLQLSGLITLTFLFLNAITWMVSGNGPWWQGNDTYWGRRVMGLGIGIGCLIIAGVVLMVMHWNERDAQSVPED